MISAARKVAFETLRLVQSENAYATDVLHAALRGDIGAADAALATELTLGVLRWQGLLDFLLERLLNKPLDRLDLAVALALRMGLYQLRFLRRIPPRAAVNESVEMVKRARKASAAALVNAVLRKAAAESATPADAFIPLALPPATRLSLLYSHPQWIVDRWLARFGESRTGALLDANNRTPMLSIAPRDPRQTEEIAGELAGDGLRTERPVLVKSAWAVKGGSVTRTSAFREGRISIQDEASQTIPLLLDVHSGNSVLDLCAAPGGKTAALARAAGHGARIVAADLHRRRLRDMGAQFERAGVRNVLLAQLDATQTLPFAMQFDRVLVDAPCSGTGTLARHPEIRWRLQPRQIDELHGLQVAILRKAAESLITGGRLVYSTCSLEREENEEVAAEVLERDTSLRRISATETADILQPHLVSGIQAAGLFDDFGYFHTVPGQQQTDGFFAAILQKT